MCGHGLYMRAATGAVPAYIYLSSAGVACNNTRRCCTPRRCSLIVPLDRQPAAAVAMSQVSTCQHLLTNIAGPQTACVTPRMQRHQVAAGRSRHHGGNTAARFTVARCISAGGSMRFNEDVHSGAYLPTALGIQVISAQLCVSRTGPQRVDRGTGSRAHQLYLWPPPACARTRPAPGLTGVAACMACVVLDHRSLARHGAVSTAV